MLGSHVNGLQSMQPISSFQQECIPVGCVPAAHWPYSRVWLRGGGMSAAGGCLLRGGVCSRGDVYSGGVCSQGLSAWGGVCSQGGVCSGGVSTPGCLLWGVSAPGECLLPGRCLLPGGVSAPGGCLLLGGICSQGGVCSGGVSAPRGWYPSMHWGRHPPPVNRMTNRCKNITLATTSLRPVTISLVVYRKLIPF